MKSIPVVLLSLCLVMSCDPDGGDSTQDAGTSQDALHDELAAGLVPGVFLVPDVFVSMQRAQKRGVAYVFTDRSR